MKTGIYKITNKITGKSYIGQSLFIERRWKDEKTAAFCPSDAEYNYSRSQAIRKYGLENFTFEIIEECKPDELNEREKYWIKHYNSYYDGYNETLGGDSAITSSKMTEEDLSIIIKLLKENVLSEQSIAKTVGYSIGTISEINQGHIWKRDNESYPLRKRVNQSNHQCPYCGKIIDSHSTMCVQCAKDKTFNFKVPTKEELTSLLYQYKGNMSAIGRLYGISKNPIKRLINEYQLNELIEEIKHPIAQKSIKKVMDDCGNIFTSHTEANHFYNTTHVKDVCDGLRKTTAGHKFKWLDD